MQELKHEEFYETVPMEGLVVPPPHASGVLENALQRYLAVHLVTDGVIPFKQVLRDRTNFIEFYKIDRSGRAIIDERNQVEFMHAVSGLPRTWCAYWTYMDYLGRIVEGTLQGDTDELVEAGYRSALEITMENA